MTNNADRLRQRLRSIGLSDAAIHAAWPTWWSEAADASASAQTDLRFSLSRKLGLEPHSLLQDDEKPRFIWRDAARFKHLRGEGELERAAIASFGIALGRYLLEATGSSQMLPHITAHSLRDAILKTKPYVRLVDLISTCWALGIPLIHLQVFPCTHKRMAAMSVGFNGRNAIMVGKDSNYPAQIAFYIAHELGHISLGHLTHQSMLVDLDGKELSNNDEEEIAADRFALELLTGQPHPTVLPKGASSPRELARAARQTGAALKIEPGTLALCFAFSTKNWGTANAAMPFIYESPKPVWSEINNVALNQLNLDAIPEDARSYLTSVIGTSTQP